MQHASTKLLGELFSNDSSVMTNFTSTYWYQYIANAQDHPSVANWAGGIVKQYRHGACRIASPVMSSGAIGLHSLGFLGFQANMEGQLC